MGQSYGVHSDNTNNKNDEQSENLTEVKCTEQHQKEQSEYLVERGKYEYVVTMYSCEIFYLIDLHWHDRIQILKFFN